MFRLTLSLEAVVAMQTQAGARSEINITPYIDVLLVLLIAFMIMSQRMVIFANLAQESGSTTPSEARTIVLELANDGRYLINTQEVAKAGLEGRLREIMAPRRDRVLYIKSGGQRLYAETIEAMGIARGAGVEVLALAP